MEQDTRSSSNEIYDTAIKGNCGGLDMRMGHNPVGA